MKNWGIKNRVLLLALLPTLIIALSLSFYYGYNSVSQFESALNEKGVSLSRSLAPACEFGVFSANMEVLSKIIEQTLADKDIVNITISNNNNEPLISRGQNSPPDSIKYSMFSLLIPKEEFTFTTPVVSTEIEINDFTELESASSVLMPQTIGYVHITLSSLNTRISQFTSVLKGLFITGIGMLITIMLAIRISKSVVDPIQKLTHAVSQIAKGQLDTRLSTEAGGEIGLLESGVNTMADEIQASREDLQSRVDKATSKLKKALDDLEIQNIELDLARGRALTASKIKSEFLANMSHEIRTPMNGVIGYTELLEKTSLTSQQHEYVNTIRNSASNLLTIINDILDFSKIESGKMEIERISFNLPELISEMISLFAPMAYKKNIELILFPYPDIPQQLIGDPSRIRQILVNLIGNAIKFTNKGHVTIRVMATNTVDNNINIKFTVSDTGIGLDSVSKQRLFTAFTQADTSISRKFGGTGLGLVISKKLAVLMQGDIGFESSPNQGTTFWLTLSLAIAKKQASSKPKSNNIIILCDQIDQTRIALRALFNQSGIETIETSSVDKISQLLNERSQANIQGIVLGVNRNNLNNASYLSTLSMAIQKIDIPALVIASACDINELIQLNQYKFNNIISRSAKHNVILEKLQNTIQGTLPPTDSDQEIHTVDIIKNEKLSELLVLLVDDNRINLKLVQTFLENNSVQVKTAEDGEQAIECSNMQHFDLILMDLHMPKIDGFVATEYIRNNPGPSQNSIIIALTANAMKEEQMRAFNCGMNDILLKPVSEQQLINTLIKWTLRSTKPVLNKDIKMLKENIETPVYDNKQGIELAGGNPQLAKELLNMLIKELPGHKDRLESAMNNQDMRALKYTTHKIHGATAYCGVPRLRMCAHDLEDIIDTEQTLKLDQACQNLLSAIDELIQYQA